LEVEVRAAVALYLAQQEPQILDLAVEDQVALTHPHQQRAVTEVQA
jgi:hypothetical protein